MKFKFLAIFFLATAIVWGAKLTVKGASVNLSINGEVKKMENNNWKTVSPGTTIRFLSGKGIVEIQSNHAPYILSEKGPKVYTVPKAKGFLAWSKNQWNKLVAPPKETNTSGVSKGSNGKIIEHNISIGASEKNIIIHSRKWGPFPITLSIIRDKQRIVEYFFDDSTQEEIYFVISTDVLQNGDHYEVVAGKGKPGENIPMSGRFIFSEK